MSGKSEGGCVKCHSSSNTAFRMSRKPVSVTPAQSGCFDCSIYGSAGTAYGPTCTDFGTPAFDDCKMRSQCKCMHCCRFEYFRRHRPERLRDSLEDMSRALPVPLSESGKAFQDGRATVSDVNKMLRWKEQKKDDWGPIR